MKLSNISEAKTHGAPPGHGSGHLDFDRFVLTYFDKTGERDWFYKNEPNHIIDFKVKPEYIIRLKSRSKHTNPQEINKIEIHDRGGEVSVEVYKTTGGKIRRKLNQPPEKLFTVFKKMFG